MQLQQFVVTAWLLLVTYTVLLVDAQGPFPPRLSIPGAVVSHAPGVNTRPQFRNDKLVRVRRPVPLRAQNTFAPSLAPRIIEEPKPVTESAEDEQPDVFLPQLLREQQLVQAQQAQFQHQAQAFLNGDANSLQESPSLTQLLQEDEPIVAPAPPAPRFPERPTPAAAAASSIRPSFNDFGIGNFGNGAGSQRFGLERPQPSAASAPPQPQPPQRVNVIRTRPAAREPRPQYEPQQVPQSAQAAVVRSRPRPVPARPLIEHNQVQQEERDTQPRRQRPVAQTLRKWREENEDGSITWGYENDDGSFKEEIIGTDCITKGTYGYVDPDGNKREYNYETGIKCDPNTRETEEELQQNGFINYEENKAVLPNGIEIDMSQIGKRKSKRPNANYRN